MKLFVYGTLRVGHGNWYWMRDAIISTERDCVLEGARIYNVYNSREPIYPVLKLTGDPADKVIGDILELDPDHPDTGRVYRMEIGAGYDPVVLEVEVPGQPTHTACEVFVYRRDPEGPHIRSGDWNVFARHEILEV